MKCANGVDGVSAEEDGAKVCTPNEIASETKTPSFKADSRSQLSDMQMQGGTIEVFKHTQHKHQALCGQCLGSAAKAAQYKQCSHSRGAMLSHASRAN